MKMMMEAKKHVDALKMIAEKEGMSLDDLIEQCCGDMEDEGEMEGEGMESEDMGEEKPMPDKGKIALIIAKMKNGRKE